MTDNMKCPFCGTKFDIMKGISENVLGCPKCRHIATIGVWQALIDGKEAQNALEMAVAALNKIWHSPNEKPGPCTIITEDGEWIWDINGHYQGDYRWKNNTPWAYLQDVVDLMSIIPITKTGNEI